MWDRIVTGTPDPRRQAGFSLLEVLIASALLLLVALGILPMFSRSITANIQGNISTQVANYAREEAERLYQLPLNHPELEPDAGNTERTSKSYFSPSQKRWIDEGAWAGDEEESYLRTTRIRQFGVGALQPKGGDYQLDDGEALVGGTAASQVHIKEIQVTVESQHGYGGGKAAVVSIYKTI